MKVLCITGRTLIFAFFLLLLTFVFLFPCAESESKLPGKIIVIDVGHGGLDPGANRPGIAEKDINLAVGMKLKEILSSEGAQVVLSRESDTELSKQCDNEKVKGRYRRDLAARLELVAETSADVFVSIHANANPNPRRKGAECFFYAKSEDSKKLANVIQTELHLSLQAGENASPGNYFVLRRNPVPATLVEVGYITSPDERQLLQSPEYQYKLAAAIAKGVMNYFKESTCIANYIFHHNWRINH